MKSKHTAILCVVAGLASSTTASAHETVLTEDNPFSALLSGMSHPVSGLDHFLAMFAVGFSSIFYRPKDVWIIPGVFLTFMVIGYGVGELEVTLPAIELGIASSVIALGLCMAAQGRVARPLAMLIVAMFALFHGNVHAIELPDAGAAWLYVSGFLIGTAGIHVGGIMVADIMRKPDGHSRFITLISALVIAIGVTFAIKQLNP